MECRKCGRYEPPDPFSGYDASDLCPSCPEDDEEPEAMPEQIDPAALSEQSILNALKAIELEGTYAHLARTHELSLMVGRLEQAVSALHDKLRGRMDVMTAPW